MIECKGFEKAREVVEYYHQILSTRLQEIDDMYKQIDFSDLEGKYFLLETHESAGTFLLHIEKVTRCTGYKLYFKGSLTHWDSSENYDTAIIEDWGNAMKLFIVRDEECIISIELFQRYGSEITFEQYQKELKEISTFFSNLF